MSATPELGTPLAHRARRGPQPGAARAPGRDRQLVRAPAGQALRRRASRSRRWSRASPSTTATRRRCASCCASTPTSARGGPVSIQLFGQDPEVMRSAAATVAERGADLIDLNMGCPVPKVCKTGAGAALIKDPDTAVAVARAAREGSGPAGDRQAALGPAPGGDRRLRPRPPPRRRGGRQRDRLPPAQRRGAPQGHAGLRPRRAARRRALRRAGDPHRRPEHAAQAVRAAYERTGAAAVMLARGSLGNPWLFGQVLGTPRRRAHARRGPRRAALGDGPRRGAPRRRPRRRATCASSTPGTWTAWTPRRRSSRPCSRRPT